jgi:hypothetical protein
MTISLSKCHRHLPIFQRPDRCPNVQSRLVPFSDIGRLDRTEMDGDEITGRPISSLSNLDCRHRRERFLPRRILIVPAQPDLQLLGLDMHRRPHMHCNAISNGPSPILSSLEFKSVFPRTVHLARNFRLAIKVRPSVTFCFPVPTRPCEAKSESHRN